MNQNAGRIRLNVVEGAFTRDTDFFSKMDPYCIIKCREQTFKTKVKQNAGKKPYWDEYFDIEVKYVGDDLTITVLDEDLTSSDLVAETTIKLTALCHNQGIDDWFGVQYKGKSAGKIHLKSQFFPAQIQGMGIQPGQAGYGMQQAIGM